jgi:DNA processing protein
MEDPRYAIALRDALGSANAHTLELLQRFGAPRFVFGQPPEALVPICGARLAGRLGREPDLRAAESELARARELGIEVVQPGEEGFPPTLVTISDLPLLLYRRGNVPEAEPVAIVGSRRPSARARDAARAWAAGVAANGGLVVSGLAYGIDAAAHTGALEGGGATVAVLASGVDRPSPAGNLDLAERILAQGGALLSEFGPGTPALAAHFPARNRLISGLARVTLVVEARERSGSLITAHHALRQARELRAVPGPIDSAACRGSNALLRGGAVATNSLDDLLDDVFGIDRARSAERRAKRAAADPDTERVLSILEEGPCAVDALGARAGLPAPALSALLVELELAGRVARLGSRVARRANAGGG